MKPMPPVEALDLPALLDRYERPLVRYAQSILGDLDSARDVVQDTFIRWVQRERNAPGPFPESTEIATDAATTLEAEAPWLFTVCRNRALDHQRKHSRLVSMDQTQDRATEEPSPAA